MEPLTDHHVRVPAENLLRRYFLVAVLTLLASPALQALDLVTLQLKWLHQFQFAGYYAALEKGFYRDAGLEVEIREGGPNVDAIEDVIAGRADFGVGTSGALIARARGQPVVVLAAVFQHSPAILLVPRRAGITSVFALQDRLLMDTPGSEDIAAMLKLAGEIVDLILRRYSQAKNREALLFEANQTELLVQPDLIELGYQNPVRWRTIAETYHSLGMLPEAKVPEGLMYKPEGDGIPLWLKASLAGAAMLGLVATLVTLWIARLNRRLNSEITDRREAEREIQRARAQAESARQQLVAMSEALPLAMFQMEFKADGSVAYNLVGSRVEQILGVPLKDLMADPSLRWRHVHPDDSEVARTTLADATRQVRALEIKHSVEMIVRVLLNGPPRWVLSSAYATPPLQDGTVIWNGFYQDVTERKQAEDELKASEAYNKMLFQESHRPIVVYDPAENGFIDCNPAAVKMYGFLSRDDCSARRRSMSQPRRNTMEPTL
jgi:PAS domain-containing protein